MASDLHSDPYLALGVPKDATAAIIKSAYRKLVLTCHPDKVSDQNLKKQKQEEFHKIQEAYELIGDEEKRATYDASIRLEQLRKEKLSRAGPHSDVKATRYDVRTAAPAGATHATTGASRHDDFKPSSGSRHYEEDRFYDERASRKYTTYEAYPKHSSSSRTARPKDEPVRVTRVTADRTRSDRNKARDREDRSQRKFVYVDDDSSSNDEKARFEGGYKSRSDEDRRRRDEEDARRQAADARRKADERRSYEDVTDTRRHRNSDDEHERSRKLRDAIHYIHRSKVDSDLRPSPPRTSSSRDVRPEVYNKTSSRRDRPDAVRRSSARPSKDRPSSSSRDGLRKLVPEIVDWEDDRKPSFKHSHSSPTDLHVPKVQRSYTDAPPRDYLHAETSTTPLFRRSETMPSVAHTSSRRKDSTVPRPSGLRSSESATPREAESAYPTVPPPAPTTTYYHYATPGGGVSVPRDEVASGHRTILREPERRITRSPSPVSPISRPPIGINRPAEKVSSRTTSSAMPPPPLGRAATFNANTNGEAREERGRSGRLFREVSFDHTKRENARRQTSFSPDTISFANKIGPDDIRWSRPREGSREEYPKPSLGRTATYVC